MGLGHTKPYEAAQYLAYKTRSLYTAPLIPAAPFCVVSVAIACPHIAEMTLAYASKTLRVFMKGKGRTLDDSYVPRTL
jgi:hypothetical protein